VLEPEHFIQEVCLCCITQFWERPVNLRCDGLVCEKGRRGVIFAGYVFLECFS